MCSFSFWSELFKYILISPALETLIKLFNSVLQKCQAIHSDTETPNPCTEKKKVTVQYRNAGEKYKSKGKFKACCQVI